MKFVIILLLGFLASSFAFAGAVITYHGRILEQSGRPLDSNNVTFKIQIFSPNPGKCLLYEEVRTVSTSGRDGVFVIPIGDGDGTRGGDDPNISLERVFANESGYQFDVAKFPKFNCHSGGNVYAPQALDQRQLVVSFKDNNSAFGFQNLPKMDINFVPLAVSSYDSQNLGGIAATQYLKVDGAVPSALTAGNFTELVNVLNGTTTQYAKSTQIGSGPNQLLQVGSDGKLPAVDGSNLTGITASVLSPTANITTSGTISTSNNIQTTKDMTANRLFLFNNGGIGPESVGFQVSNLMAGGSSYSVTMPLAKGTANQVLKIGSVAGNNAQLIWDTVSGGGGVSSVTASSPLLSSGGATPDISMPKASASADGYLSSADWSSFDNKQAANSELTALAGLATLGILQKTGSNSYTGLGLAAPLNVTGMNITMSQANSTTSGYLSFADWNTFNSKAAANDARIVGALQNAGGTPSIQSGDESSRPAFGNSGRLYIATDSKKIYRDTGGAWEELAGAAAMTVSSANSDITVTNGSTAPVLTLNSGTGPDKILKLDNAGKLPVVDGSAVTNVSVTIDKITNAATKYFDYRPNNVACTSGQTLSYSPGTGWVCASASSGTVTSVTATGPLSSTGGTTPQISLSQAGSSSNGFLSSTDWNTFNNGSTGTISAARMPALSGDVTSSAGSTAVTLNTVPISKGGTGLTSLGTSHQFLSVNGAGSSIEYKTLVAGSGISLSPVDGTLTISTSGAGGGIQSPVTLIATQGTACSTMGQLATNVNGDLLVCDEVPSQLDGSVCSTLGAGAFSVDEGGNLYVCLN